LRNGKEAGKTKESTSGFGGEPEIDLLLSAVAYPGERKVILAAG